VDEENNRMQLRPLLTPKNPIRRLLPPMLGAAAFVLAAPVVTFASEADLILPDLNNPDQKFFGMTGHALLTLGLGVALLGIVFGMVIYAQLKRLAVHQSMREVSDLIYETCKTYLLNQGRFILILWVCIAAVLVAYFGFLSIG
jgi:K(+)-stimulated pyrophosphate-energized sodium pump